MDLKNLINKTILGKYKIIRKITDGGMDSTIFLAENIDYDNNDYFGTKFKYAAVKIIKKTLESASDQWLKLLDEGITAGRVSYRENIINLYDFLKVDDETIIIVMEYISGPSLSRYIVDKGWLSSLEAIWIMKQIAIAINQLHSNSRMIIHRDLKPDNILLSQDLSVVKLIDFGISSVLEKTSQNGIKILTKEESFYGTIPYLSPDILKFRGKDVNNHGNLITKQFDFYSMGVIFYEMLTGKKPFKTNDEDDPNSIKLPLVYDFRPIKEINPGAINDLENMIIRMMASKQKYIALRYDNISEIMKDLEKCEKKIKENLKEDDLLISIEERILQDPDKKVNIPKVKIDKFIYSWSSIFLLIFIIVIILFILNNYGVF